MLLLRTDPFQSRSSGCGSSPIRRRQGLGRDHESQVTSCTGASSTLTLAAPPATPIGQPFASTLDVYKGIVTGALAGLAGTWAMSEAQRLWTYVVDGDTPQSAGGRHDARDWQERSEHQNSNELAAHTIARSGLGRRLTRHELRYAAPLLPYLFGATMGAVYGAYAQRRQGAASGAGFGTTVWLAADEIAMPLLGLSHSTARRPVEMHLQSWVAHLVFGTATEMTRRSLHAHFGAAADAA
jgi:hypothetical protein